MHLGLALVLALGCNIASIASSQDVEDSDGSSVSGLYSNRTTETIRIQDEYYGIRHVNYWVTSDNHAIIDGDVVYPGTLEDLLAKQYTGPDFGEDEDEGEESGHSSANLTSSLGRRSLSIFRGSDAWPKSTVVYRYSNAAAQKKVGRYVNNAINGWRRRAPYLRFRRVGNGGGTRKGVLTITALPNDGCYAHVGYSGGYGTVMNLGNGCYSDEALHEFGHALGLEHEHQRPDRERYVHFACQNLDPQCRNMPRRSNCCNRSVPKGCCGNKYNFDLIRSGKDWSGPYDLHSIMHYTADSFAISGRSTLVPARRGGWVPTVGPSTLSRWDVRRICQIYGGRRRC